jgi:hypothetical protein
MKAARIIALAFLAFFLFSTQIAPSQSTYSIRGQVVDESGAWVSGASVRLYSAQRVLDLRADGDGKFEFANVPKGTYELAGSSAGFLPGTVDVEIAEKVPEPFSIVLHVGRFGSGGYAYCTVQEDDINKVVASVGLRVSYEKRSGKMDLSGVERDQFGSPLLGVIVKIVREGTMRETVSNEKGEFTFSGLEPGKYSLQSTHEDYSDIPGKVWITRENVAKAAVTLVESRRLNPPGCLAFAPQLSQF